MKLKNSAWIMMVWIFTLSLSLLADNELSVGEMNPSELGGIPIELKNTDPLSFFSAIIHYPKTMEIQPGDIQLSSTRFPWKKRGVMISVDEPMHKIIITVADLLGQNTMVLPGKGRLFSIISPGSQNLKDIPAFQITNVEAYDLKGNTVKVRWQ